MPASDTPVTHEAPRPWASPAALARPIIALFRKPARRSIRRCVDAATDETLSRVNWDAAFSLWDEAFGLRDGIPIAIDAILERLEYAGPTQQRNVLFLLHWSLSLPSAAFITSYFYHKDNIARLANIWTSDILFDQNRLIFSAIVDLFPPATTPKLENNVSWLRHIASEAGLLSSYDPNTVVLDLPSGPKTISQIQAALFQENNTTSPNSRPATMLQLQTQPASSSTPQQVASALHSSLSNHFMHLPLHAPTVPTTNMTATQPQTSQQIMLLDHVAHAEVVENTASMLAESLNFAPPAQDLSKNDVVQGFLAACTELRKTTLLLLERSLLSSAARQSLKQSEKCLDTVLREYENQVTSRIVDQIAAAEATQHAQTIAAFSGVGQSTSNTPSSSSSASASASNHGPSNDLLAGLNDPVGETLSERALGKRPVRD